MADLMSKLKELVGDEELASKIQSSLGEFMIPKTEYAKQRDRAKELESQIEQNKLASMSEQEKLQHELEKAQALQRDYASKVNRVEAESLFVKAGLSAEEYGTLLDKTVTDNKEQTLSVVSGFVDLLTKQKEAVANKTKADLMNSLPTPPNGDNVTPPEPKPINIKTNF